MVEPWTGLESVIRDRRLAERAYKTLVSMQIIDIPRIRLLVGEQCVL